MSDSYVPSELNPRTQAVTIDPLVQQPARWVIRFYWIVIPTSLILYLLFYRLYHKTATLPVIELAFYPMLFATGFLVKSFLWRKIPDTFRRLVQLGTLSAKELDGILSRYEQRLDHKAGLVLGIVLGLTIVVFYDLPLPSWDSLRRWPGGEATIHTAIAAIDILLGYAAGVVVWKLGVTATEIRLLANEKLLQLQVFHPDRCQGLSPIGSLTLAISHILAVVGFFFLVFIVWNRWVIPEPTQIYLAYEFWFLIGFSVTIATSVVAFVWPLMRVHRMMRETADHASVQLDELASRISQAEQSLIRRSFELDDAAIKAEEAKIEVLKRLYHQHDHVSTWPIDLPTYRKFFATQIPLWLGVVSTAWGLLKDMLAT